MMSPTDASAPTEKVARDGCVAPQGLAWAGLGIGLVLAPMLGMIAGSGLVFGVLVTAGMTLAIGARVVAGSADRRRAAEHGHIG